MAKAIISLVHTKPAPKVRHIYSEGRKAWNHKYEQTHQGLKGRPLESNNRSKTNQNQDFWVSLW